MRAAASPTGGFAGATLRVPRRWRRERWDEPGTIYFWSGRAGAYEAFSNFAATPFRMRAWHAELGDVEFASGEHAFQAASVGEHERIRQARTPLAASGSGVASSCPPTGRRAART